MPPAVVAPPPTQTEPVTETLHGVEITDPYRWLEDQNSPRTRAWIEEQTAYTRAYLDAMPGREQIRERVRELLAVKEVISEPWNVGGRYFFLKRQNHAEQPVIVMRDGLFGRETVLVDPALRATGSSIAVDIAAISEDGRFLAYSVRQGGTDHSSIEILDLEKSMVLPDRLPEGFCSGIAFASDGSGFYYSHRELSDPHPNYRAVFWHRFGTGRSQDQEIFFAGEASNLFLGILHSHEAKLLAYVVLVTGNFRRTSIHLKNTESESSESKLLLQDIEGCFVPFFVKGMLFACTDLAAANFRIVLINLADSNPKNWHDIVPEADRRIQGFAVAGEHIFVTRVDHFSTRVEVFSLDGRRTQDILPPKYASVDLLNRTTASDKLFYSYTSISKPSSVRCYDTRNTDMLTWDEVNISFAFSQIEINEAAYSSKDGSSIPILLVSRKDLVHSGPLPTFITGYGGFGSCVTPRFTAFASFLIEQGCLFAVPALRGGAELGEQWHKAGMREKRQNAFDDFIAAAEWLVSTGRSCGGRIAIGGGSNAGLLVGAAITQRPELFRAAVCLGPLLDMARYHLFDFAADWTDEYGSAADEQDFKFLISYSPYHCVTPGVEYPAVLFISGDSDTRCNPMHARKMAARLQAATTSGRSILLDYKPNWGHSPAQPHSIKIEALTDRLAFICGELGIYLQSKRPS